MTHTSSIHELLDGYASGSVTWGEMLLVDAHVKNCELCRIRLAGLLRSRAEMTPDSPPPSDVWPRILTAIDR